jgi:RNA polymerase primary sigma factor
MSREPFGTNQGSAVAEMKKKAGKPFMPTRRAVKRGAPPIIKPRRAMTKAAAMKARPAKAALPGTNPAPEKEEISEAAILDLARVDEHEELGLAGASLVVARAEAAPEEAAELDAAVIEGERDEAEEADPAEAEPAEAEPAEEKTEAGTPEPSNFLAMYFKEMAELDVLRPEEEFRQAKDIETLEFDLWDRIFAYPPIVEHVLKVVERTLENSLVEFRPLRKALADAKKSPKNLDKLAKAAHKVSERLRALDIDKRILEIVLVEFRKIARGEMGRVVNDRLPFAPKAPAFRKYYSDVRSGMARAQHAKNEFVKANLRLVVSIARRFNHGRMPLADLIQEGNIGLIKAVERFDYRRGYRFSTYASWWIRHAISRALADKGRAVRLPVHMIDAYHRVAKSKRELAGKLGRQPTVEEIGAATGIAAAKVEKMRSYLLDQSFSLDRPVSDEDGRRFIDFIQDPSAETSSPVETLADAAMTTEVRDLLSSLKPIEADILRQRFGLDDDKELTLKEIGEKYNLSRERIRQLQEQALTKMRRALQRKELM